MNRKIILVTLETVSVGTCSPWREKLFKAFYGGLLALLLGVFSDTRLMGKAGITAAASTVANDGLPRIICPPVETNPTDSCATHYLGSLCMLWRIFI